MPATGYRCAQPSSPQWLITPRLNAQVAVRITKGQTPVDVKETRAIARLRLVAFVIDWLVIAAWGGLLFGFVMVVTGGNPPRPGGPWKAQAVSLVAMTVPFALYFALGEASRWRGTLGKHLVGLVVCRRSEQRLSFGRALLRNAIKLVPWEFGHTVAHQAIYASDGVFPLWLWGPAVVSMLGPLWWIVALFANGDTPYDRWTDARVARRARLQG